ARLPGAGSSDDEQRPLGGEDGLPLGRIEVCEVAFGRGDGHAADAIGAAPFGVQRARPQAPVGRSERPDSEKEDLRRVGRNELYRRGRAGIEIEYEGGRAVRRVKGL